MTLVDNANLNQNCPQQTDDSSCGVFAVSCFRRVLTNTHNGALTRTAADERLSYLKMLVGMTPEQKGRLPLSYQSTVEDLKVSEQEVDGAKVAVLEAQNKVNDAKANLETVEQVKEMSDVYVDCSSNDKRLGWQEKERPGLEDIDEEKAQLHV